MFDLSEKEAMELGSIQKGDVIEWYRTYLRHPSPKCRRLAVRVWGCYTDWNEVNAQLSAAQLIEDPATFKKLSAYYPSMC